MVFISLILYLFLQLRVNDVTTKVIIYTHKKNSSGKYKDCKHKHVHRNILIILFFILCYLFFNRSGVVHSVDPSLVHIN